jgi:hypothetical protein
VKPRHLNCSEPSDFKYTATLTQLSFCVRNRIIFPMGSCLFYISATFPSTITPPTYSITLSSFTFNIPDPVPLLPTTILQRKPMGFHLQLKQRSCIVSVFTTWWLVLMPC